MFSAPSAAPAASLGGLKALRYRAICFRDYKVYRGMGLLA